MTDREAYSQFILLDMCSRAQKKKMCKGFGDSKCEICSFRLNPETISELSAFMKAILKARDPIINLADDVSALSEAMSFNNLRKEV